MLRLRPSHFRAIHTTASTISNNLCQTTKSASNALFYTGSRSNIKNYKLACNSSVSPLKLNLGSISYYTNLPPPNRGNSRMRFLTAAGGSALVLASKGKYILGALKLTKFASLGSMFLSVGAYSMVFGLPYAAGMVGQIVLHESGHALVMKHYGIPFSPMIFIPFIGASVTMNRNPQDAYQEAMIAFGGPVAGTIGAVSLTLTGAALNSQLCYALADFGFMINLFNMLPIGFMDGGRICGALSPYAGVGGVAIGGMMIYNGIIHNPIFYLAVAGGAYTTFMRFYDPAGHAAINYYNITTKQRIGITGGYFGLLGVLLSGMALNAQFKQSPQEIQYQRDTYQEQYWTDE